MSSLEQVTNLRARIERLTLRTRLTSGPGAEWAAEVPGHGLQSYQVTGMTSPDELEDTLAHLCMEVWNLKDYLKRHLVAIGRDPRDVERFVDADPDLPVCADLANSTKHGGLDRTRTGRSLRAGRVTFSMPQGALGSLTVFANKVQVDIRKPEFVTFAYPVIDRDGNEVGDAMQHLINGVAAWERFIHRL